MSVYSVSSSSTHSFAKPPTSYIYLLPSSGVQGDAHCTSDSNRQVHLIASEFLATYSLSAGDLGENITTTGIDLLHLSEGSRLHFGDEGGAVVRVTGVREPWRRLEEWPAGVLDSVREGDRKGRARVGVYGIVEREGYVQAGYGVWVDKGKGGKLHVV